ncbi:hypothetical protein Hanom_Chr16g01489921 [Helianthus anomalus]
MYVHQYIVCNPIDVYGQDFNLAIHQVPTRASGEWDVTLENTGPCVILEAYLDCKGFQSHIEIDPKVIVKQGDVCIVQRIYPRNSLHFIYTWETQFPFKLLNQSIACS